MTLRAPEIEIVENNPFQNDLLDRSESAELLMQLISSTSGPLVLSIDSPWGTGKTTFLTMWRQLLVNNRFLTLYFNAWENDFSDDALVSLIGEIETGIEILGLDGESQTKSRENFQRVKKIGVGLIKKSIPLAVKLATSGLLDLDDLAEKSISELGEKIATEQISKYESSKKTIQSFRKQLATFAKDISRVDENNKHFPLIILIDELDRCRPTYAIEILEKAKHFFNVENIIFVLSMDKEQIGHSIQSVYGIGMNVDGYLRRFIDLDYFLPPPSKGKFCKALFRRFGLDEYFQKRKKNEFINDKDQFIGVFSELFSIFDFSLRVQEQCFSLLSVALKTTPENYSLYPILLGALISLKAENSQIYKAFISRKATAQDVLEYIQKKPKGDEYLRSNYGTALEAYLVASFHDRYARDVDVRAPYSSIMESEKSSEREKERANRILQLFKDFDWHDSFGTLDYVVKKIELVSQFSP